jgi:exodeoxyribonuclease-1
MTRALRPLNISWPFDSKGNPSNRLELLAAVNKLEHSHAHEALSDVTATIGLARLIKSNQPKMFDYLLSLKDKQAVEKIVRSGQPFVYTCGKYASEFEKTTVVISLGPHPSHQGDLVYDLRYDPSRFAGMEASELAELWRWQPDVKSRPLPVKTLQFNRCPAIAPLSVLDKDSKLRLKLDMTEINHNWLGLKKMTAWPGRLHQALELMDEQRQAQLITSIQEVDGLLYEGFIGRGDEQKLLSVRQTPPERLGSGELMFADQRLNNLLPLYKARNFPGSLNAAEQQNWKLYLKERLLGGGASRLRDYQELIKQLGGEKGLGKSQKDILTDLADYGVRLRSLVGEDPVSKIKKSKQSNA